ncbi:MAG: ATP-binding cassette domain-containing protein [Pseudomonadota bacterium]
MATQPTDNGHVALELRDVEFRYPSTGFALSVPAFTLGAGERVLLRGPSGSGKTTLLALAAGLLAADRGTIRVDDRTMPTRLAACDRLRAETIGIIYQQFNLLASLDTLSNVLLPTAFGRRRVEAGTAIDLLDQLGIPSQLHAAPAGRLSVGQQQRVAIARALIGAPPLILADEPTSALDPDSRDAFLEVLFDTVAAAGAALLLVSHDAAISHRFPRVHDLRDIARTGDAIGLVG